MPVEVVIVGDAPLDARLEALVQAAREAMTNAAKFAGAERVDLYAEVGPARVEVFVRDRGVGFDPARSPTTGAACATRSSGGWSATAAARRPQRARRGHRGRAGRCAAVSARRSR